MPRRRGGDALEDAAVGVQDAERRAAGDCGCADREGGAAPSRGNQAARHRVAAAARAVLSGLISTEAISYAEGRLNIPIRPERSANEVEKQLSIPVGIDARPQVDVRQSESSQLSADEDSRPGNRVNNVAEQVEPRDRLTYTDSPRLVLAYVGSNITLTQGCVGLCHGQRIVVGSYNHGGVKCLGAGYELRAGGHDASVSKTRRLRLYFRRRIADVDELQPAPLVDLDGRNAGDRDGRIAAARIGGFDRQRSRRRAGGIAPLVPRRPPHAREDRPAARRPFDPVLQPRRRPRANAAVGRVRRGGAPGVPVRRQLVRQGRHLPRRSGQQRPQHRRAGVGIGADELRQGRRAARSQGRQRNDVGRPQAVDHRRRVGQHAGQVGSRVRRQVDGAAGDGGVKPLVRRQEVGGAGGRQDAPGRRGRRRLSSRPRPRRRRARGRGPRSRAGPNRSSA